MIPAVRALIGPERELKAGWFEKVRWLRQLHATRSGQGIAQVWNANAHRVGAGVVVSVLYRPS